MASNVETVKALWRAFERGGVDDVLRHVHPDAEWRPSSAGGRALSADELRGHFRALKAAGVEVRARADVMEDHGDAVLVCGSLRVERWGSLSESTMVWAYRLRDGRVREALAFHCRADALAAIGAAPAVVAA